MVAIPTGIISSSLSISYKRRNKERNSIRKRRIDDNKVPQKQLLGVYSFLIDNFYSYMKNFGFLKINHIVFRMCITKVCLR